MFGEAMREQPLRGTDRTRSEGSREVIAGETNVEIWSVCVGLSSRRGWLMVAVVPQRSEADEAQLQNQHGRQELPRLVSCALVHPALFHALPNNLRGTGLNS